MINGDSDVVVALCERLLSTQKLHEISPIQFLRIFNQPS